MSFFDKDNLPVKPCGQDLVTVSPLNVLVQEIFLSSSASQYIAVGASTETHKRAMPAFNSEVGQSKVENVNIGNKCEFENKITCTCSRSRALRISLGKRIIRVPICRQYYYGIKFTFRRQF